MIVNLNSNMSSTCVVEVFLSVLYSNISASKLLSGIIITIIITNCILSSNLFL